MKYIPILQYHKIGDSPSWVSATIFKQHLQDIQRFRFVPVFIRQLMDHHLGVIPLPEKPIMITFDGAYDNFYTTAAPLLFELDIKSVCFVPAGHVGKSNEWDHEEPYPSIFHMDWDQICNLNKSRLIDFQAHSNTHPNLTFKSLKQILFELIYSKMEMQDRLQKRIEYLAWPFGAFNETCIKAAQEVGYAAAFTTKNSMQKLNDIQPYALNRLSVTNTKNIIETLNAQLNV